MGAGARDDLPSQRPASRRPMSAVSPQVEYDLALPARIHRPLENRSGGCKLAALPSRRELLARARHLASEVQQ